MKRIIIKAVCLIISIIFISYSLCIGASSLNTDSYTQFSYYNNVNMYENENDIFIIGTKNNYLYFKGVNNTLNIELYFKHNIISYTLCNDYIVVLCNDSNNNTEVSIYNIYTDTFRSINFSYSLSKNSCDVTYSNSKLFVIENNKTVYEYNQNGKLQNTYTFNDTINSLLCDYNSNVYALSVNGLYTLSSGTVTKIINDSFYKSARFIDNDVLIDGYGNIYSLSDRRKITKYKSNCYLSCGGCYDKYIVVATNNTIYAINKDTGKEELYYNLNENINTICVKNNTIYVTYYKDSIFKISDISTSKLTKIPTNQNNDAQHINNTSNNITSSVYNIDYENYKITGIPPKTTVAQFKKNVNYDGYSISFTKYNGKSYNSSNVGTASIVKFYNDNISYEFELSVMGDLTGEGNVNSLDKDLLFDYLLGDHYFDGVYITSSDFDSNNVINTKDLVRLLRLIEEYK